MEFSSKVTKPLLFLNPVRKSVTALLSALLNPREMMVTETTVMMELYIPGREDISPLLMIPMNMKKMDPSVNIYASTRPIL
jgi:hypothetical protein